MSAVTPWGELPLSQAGYGSPADCWEETENGFRLTTYTLQFWVKEAGLPQPIHPVLVQSCMHPEQISIRPVVLEVAGETATLSGLQGRFSFPASTSLTWEHWAGNAAEKEEHPWIPLGFGWPGRRMRRNC